MSYIDYPFHFSTDGRTARTGHDDHVRDLIEQVLLTRRGERLNQPEFGCGLLQFPFECLRDERLAVMQVTVRAEIERWLGALIEVEDLQVVSDESTVTVTLRYIVRGSGREHTETFSGSTAS